jgi:hypothetical protein
MTGLIGGSITYNPEPLERSAAGNVLVCCSQPNAGVTLISKRKDFRENDSRERHCEKFEI